MTEQALDVAISFLARDAAMATELYDLIASGLNVFLFPRNQEELAGTDGLESMREPFLTARVIVVLYRAPWGSTPWTRVEETAIKDRCLEKGWDALLFVQLDDSVLPKWLPSTHVRFVLTQYGIIQLAGAIKARAQHQGATIQPTTVLDRARIYARDAALLEDQQRFFFDRSWIESHVHRDIAWVMGRIVSLAEEMRTKHGIDCQTHCGPTSSVLRDKRVSVFVGWRQGIWNSIREEAELQVAEFNGPVYVPSERMMIFQPKELKRIRFLPRLGLPREAEWEEKGRNHPPLSRE